MAQTHDDPNIYYVPHHSPWPFVGSITLFVTAIGVVGPASRCGLAWRTRVARVLTDAAAVVGGSLAG